MTKKFAYIRVSSKEQNIDRQLEAIKETVIDERDIFIDKQSGKDFNRENYQAMKRCLRKEDVLYIKSIDRLGRNYKEILKEWRELTGEGVDIIVIDMPLLNTTLHKDLLGNFINDLILQVLSYVAEQERMNIKQRQSEGILTAKAKGTAFGRPSIEMPAGFEKIYKKWKESEITAVQAMKELDLKKSSFYKIAKSYEN
jgi:DNA invertase Pin-like site-specific DNA recombinase